MSPTHLSPVVFKDHETCLRVSSAGAGRGGTSTSPTPRTRWFQPAQPAHTGPSGRRVRSHKNSNKNKAEYRNSRRQKEREEQHVKLCETEEKREDKGEGKYIQTEMEVKEVS